MAFSFVILGIGAILVTFFLIDKIHKYSVRETLIKASASVMFISLAVYHNFLKGFTPFGSLVIVALVLGLLGDVWLDLKYVFPEEDKAFTYAGFVCFGLGHIAFMSGMFIEFYVPLEGASACSAVEMTLNTRYIFFLANNVEGSNLK